MTDSNTDGLAPDGAVLVPKPDYPRIESNHWTRHGKELAGEVKEIVVKAGPKGKK